MQGPRDLFRLIGTVIDDKYRVDAVLGEGGFGVVYAGTHLYLGQPVAIKCMKLLGATSDEEERLVSLFLREAKVLFSLTHPGIVRFYDIGVIQRELGQVPYAVLELIRGRPLANDIASRAGAARPFTPGELRGIIEPALLALAFAHRSGVAHRDIKPSNILLVDGDGGVKLVDFGIARWLSDPGAVSGMTGLTPAYAAPEQWDARIGPSGPPSDVFSMALLIEEMCTLRSRYADLPATQILADLMRPGARISLRAARPDLPEALDSVLERALSVHPQDRYPSASELLADFREALRGVASAAVAGAPAEWGRIGPGGLETGTPIARTGARPAPARWTLPVGLAGGVLVAGAAALLLRSRLTAPAPPAPVEVTPTMAGASAAPPDPFEGLDVTLAAIAPGLDLPAEPAIQVAGAHREGLLRCYRSAFAGKPVRAGEISVLVSVAKTGSVFATQDMDEGTIDTEALRDAGLRVCIAQEAMSWTFPTHTKDDVAGVLYTFRFHRGPAAPPSPAPAERDPVAGLYVSVFSLKSTHEIYPAEDTLFEQRGNRVVGNYPDGTVACNRDKDKLTCRWCQTDHNGRAALTVKPTGKLVGVWGYEPSESNGGGWTVTPKKRK